MAVNLYQADHSRVINGGKQGIVGTGAQAAKNKASRTVMFFNVVQYFTNFFLCQLFQAGVLAALVTVADPGKIEAYTQQARTLCQFPSQLDRKATRPDMVHNA